MDKAVKGKKSPLETILGGGAEIGSKVDSLLGKSKSDLSSIDKLLGKSKGALSNTDALLGKTKSALSSVDKLLGKSKSGLSNLDTLLKEPKRPSAEAPPASRKKMRRKAPPQEGELRRPGLPEIPEVRSLERPEERESEGPNVRGSPKRGETRMSERPSESAPVQRKARSQEPEIQAPFEPSVVASINYDMKVKMKESKPVFDTAAPKIMEQIIQNQLPDEEYEDLNDLPDGELLTPAQEKSILRSSMEAVNNAFSVLVSSSSSVIEKLSFSTVHSIVTQTRNVGLEMFAEAYQMAKRNVKPILFTVALGFGCYFGVLAWAVFAAGGTFGMFFNVLQATCGTAVFGMVAEVLKRSGVNMSVDVIAAYARRNPHSHVSRLMNKKLTPRFCRTFTQRLGLADVTVADMSYTMAGTALSFSKGFATGGVVGGLISVGTMTGINLGLKGVIKGGVAGKRAARKLVDLASEVPKNLAKRVLSKKLKEEPLQGAVEDVVRKHPEIQSYSVYRKPAWVPNIPKERLEEQNSAVIEAIGRHKLKVSAAVGALVMTGAAFAGIDMAPLLPVVGLPVGTVIPIPDVLDNDVARGAILSLLSQYGVSKVIKKLKLNEERAAKLTALYQEYTGGNANAVSGITNIITDKKVYTQKELKSLKPVELKRIATQRYIAGRLSASNNKLIELIIKDQEEKASRFSKIIFDNIMHGVLAVAAENGLEAGYQAAKELNKSPFEGMTEIDRTAEEIERFERMMGMEQEKQLSRGINEYQKTQATILSIKARFDDMVGNADLTTVNAMGDLQRQLELLHSFDKQLVEQAREIAAAIEAAKQDIERQLNEQAFYLQTMEASVAAHRENIERILREEADAAFYIETMRANADQAVLKEFFTNVKSNMEKFDADMYRKALDAQYEAGAQTWGHYAQQDLPKETVAKLQQAYAEYEAALKTQMDALSGTSSISTIFQSISGVANHMDKIIQDAYGQINDARLRWEEARKAAETAFNDAKQAALEKGLEEEVKRLEHERLKQALKEANPFMEITIPGQTYIGDGLAKGMEDLLPLSIREEMRKLEYSPFMLNAVAWGSLKVTGILDIASNINDVMRGAEVAKDIYKIGNLLNEIRTNADHISSLDYGKLDEILSKRIPDAYTLIQNSIPKYNLGDTATDLVMRGAREGWTRDRLVYELGVQIAIGDNIVGMPFSWIGEKIFSSMPADVTKHYQH